MAIKFHCENCGQKVQAPDEHGGKRGQCPFCKHSIYIPAAAEEGGEIPLAPLSDQEEQKRRELLEESARLKAEFDRMNKTVEPPENDSKAAASAENRKRLTDP